MNAFNYETETYDFESEADQHEGGQCPCRGMSATRNEIPYEIEQEFDETSDFEAAGAGQRYGDLLLEGETYGDFETGRRYGDLDLGENFSDFEAPRRYGDLDFEGRDVAQQGDYEIIPPRDTRLRVTTTRLAPFRYICDLEYDVPGVGRRSICTGTLIGPRTVLTAGHCLSGLTPSRMRIIPGRNGSLEPLPATVATRFIPAPGYSPVTPTDFGIIHLANPIGNMIGIWSAAHRTRPGDAVGTSILSGGLPGGTLRVNLSGYPADKPSGGQYACTDPAQPQRRCRISSLSNPKRHRLCGTVQFRANDRLVQLSGGMLHYLNDTCPGHSGSPVWIKRLPNKGGRVLVGIHVGGDDGRGVVANQAVFITPAVRRFITTNTI